MVAHNPLFRGRWTAKKFNATVVNDIWPEVLFFTLIAIMVSGVSKFTSHQLILPTQLLTVLGTVLGLVISFRTSSAYERYQEGRKMWASIAVASKNLAQFIWIHVPVDRPQNTGDDKTEIQEQTEKDKAEMVLRHIIEKKTMINLIQAFSVSVKHFLRGEPGVYYRDLYPLICFLPRYANVPSGSLPGEFHNEADMLPLWRVSHDVPHDLQATHNVRSATEIGTYRPIRTGSLPDMTRSGNVTETSGDDEKSNSSWPKFTKAPRPGDRRKRRTRVFDPEMLLPQIASDRPLRPARNPPKHTIYDYMPVLKFFRFLGNRMLKKKKTAEDDIIKQFKKADAVESNVPVEIILVLSGYIGFLMESNLLQSAVATGLNNNLTSLQDTLTNLERIRNTPLPFAYQAHLRLSLWLYLLFLPFQIYKDFGWFTIPGTAFTSFLLVGFLEIGQEIENPFNYDLNDLDLDGFCLALQRELHEITTYTNPEPASFIFSPWNQPFAPADRRNAEDLVKLGGNYRLPNPKDGPSPGIASVKRTLVNSWRDVDKQTRER